MGYDELVDRLATEGCQPRITSLPDGSVDTYYTVFDGQGERLTDRETLGERIACGNHDSFPIERESREPGGQAVHMARQTHALGAETTLFGHLEDPVFAVLPFEAVSMGEPALIDVFSLADDDILLSEQSADLDDWSPATLEDAASSDTLRDALEADALCCGNWASIEGVTDALETLADGSVAAETVVVDPGPVSTRSNEAVENLLETLGELEGTTDVIYSVNRTELECTAEAIDAMESDATVEMVGANETADDVAVTAETGDLEALANVREAAGISGVVLHAADIAAASTNAGETVLENLAVEDPRRRTGAGDRFSAALAVGYALGWEWETILALSNCCAAYHVETATTGGRDDLRTFLTDRNTDNCRP